ncbi:MAG: riboflavin biosynthesis protein RibF [Opitutaceae bacterium]
MSPLIRTGRIFQSLESVELEPRPIHLAIGMFDGLHLGHQSVIEAALHSARRVNGLAGVLSFWPHPSRLFHPENPTPQLMNPEDKGSFLLEAGLDFVVIHPFTRAFAELEAGEFLPFVRSRLSGLHSVYVGENWRFGRGRSGDVAELVRLARKEGLTVFSAPRINHNGEPISSTRIRGHLLKGEIAEANELLGYGYTSFGRVSEGRRLGRRLGFPTLNLVWRAELNPTFGVYVVRVHSADRSVVRDGIANFGLRPTLGLDQVEPTLEVHVLEDCPWGPGDDLRVEWLDFVRPERKFPDLEALRIQISRDIEVVRSAPARGGRS